MEIKQMKERKFTVGGTSYNAAVYLVSENPVRYRIDILCAGQKCDSFQVKGFGTHADVANEPLIAGRIQEWQKANEAKLAPAKTKPVKPKKTKG
jgi:hypothetical protein